MSERKFKFEKLDKNIPFFGDTMPKDYILPKPSEKRKETADKICKWLFSENNNEPTPKEALQFISLIKIIHKNV